MALTQASGSSLLDSAGLRNKFINGKMDIWQRGTSITCPAGSYTYTADRWVVYCGGAAVNAVKWNMNVTSTPPNAINAIQIQGAASNAGVVISQRIESINIDGDFVGPLTFSCWFFQNSGSTMTPGWGINTANSADNFTAITQRAAGTFAQSAPNNTWTKLYFTVNPGAFTNLAYGLEYQISLPACLSGISFYITKCQLEPGYNVTPFEQRPYEIEKRSCLRYYWKVSAAAADGNNYMYGSGGLIYTSTGFWFPWHFPTRMRVSPTMTSGGAVGDYWIQASGGTYTCTAFPGYSVIGTDSVFMILTSSGMTVGSAALPLFNNTTKAGWIAFDAEL